MALLSDCPVDVPGLSLRHLDRATQTLVARELMLAAHLQDRAAVPAFLERHSMEESWEYAIVEWMAASPLYTRRLQRLLGYEGTGMSTINKGLQLDVGFPHQFMDVGFRLHDEQDGEFWLRSCGALLDVMPLGDEMTKGMCHDIEDPTFDATAIATNPRAQVRPVHRPPGVPKGGPHCHWTVRIRPEHPEVTQHPMLEVVERSHLAALANDPPPSAEPGGWEDYARPFDPHFELEDLSHRALALVGREFAIQGHLLMRAGGLHNLDRFGPDEAARVAHQTMVGVGRVESERLVRVLGVGDDAAAIANVARLHHLLSLDDYLGLGIEVVDADRVRITVADSPSLDEGDPISVGERLVADEGVEIVASIVQGVNPRARVERLGRGRPAAYDVVVDPAAEPAPDQPFVRVARVSTGATAVFVRRRPLRRVGAE
ncbi:MAG TPA: hypothetical protein PKA98_10350 [Acidimicrobiales bacterium]|nr:hypothetical protein [Acidimicrobiales bacterium]